MTLALPIRQCLTAAVVGIMAVGGVVTATAPAAPAAETPVNVPAEERPDGRQL